MFETENLLSQLNTGGGRRLNNKLEDWTIEVINYEGKREKKYWKKMTNLWINLNHLTCITGFKKKKETESGTKNCEEIIGKLINLEIT